jgi:type IV secretory pathway component VirB8
MPRLAGRMIITVLSLVWCLLAAATAISIPLVAPSDNVNLYRVVINNQTEADILAGDAVYLINFVIKGGPPPVEGCCP